MASILEREISQQPEVIQTFLEDQLNNARSIARNLQGKFSYVLIAARGSSDNAARYAQYLFGIQHSLQVALATPSIFTMYGKTIDLTGALVIGISQSGQSPDIVSVLTEAKKQGRPTLAITNDASSPLAQTSDYILPLDTGLEQAVAATKTYTTSLAALALLSCAMEQDNRHLELLRQVPGLMQNTLDGLKPAIEHVERYRYIDQCTVVGRGLNYSTAFETALKIKELTYVVAEPYSSADYRHGPIATARRGSPVILIAPRGSVYQDMHTLFGELKQRQAELIIISDDPQAQKEAALSLPFAPGLPEWLTPLVAVLPGQRFAMQLTLEKGLNPDQPEGLHKVTETL
ncbi:MAG: SIS domain-containing protein [Anaerolineaceae bacterium]|nr:SIS domain-containing protein [Anaerolineaceae bacterium]